MDNLEKEILDIVNPSAKQMYGHEFKSLKDTVSNPEPPYTARITPLLHLMVNYKKIMLAQGEYDPMAGTSDFEIVEWKPVLSEKQMDYLIQNSPLHYMYEATKVDSSERGYLNPLLIALEKYQQLRLTEKQYDFMIQNSDLQVNKKEGMPALVLALQNIELDNMAPEDHTFRLSNKSWALLKNSAVEFDVKVIKSLEEKQESGNYPNYISASVIEQVKEITQAENPQYKTGANLIRKHTLH